MTEKKMHYLKMDDAEISRAQDLVYDGWELMGQDLREAKKCFKSALDLNPDLADAYNGLAEVAVCRGNARAAEEFYRKAYEKAKSSLGTEDGKAFACRMTTRESAILLRRPIF